MPVVSATSASASAYASSASRPTLRMGSNGASVKTLQSMLTKAGFSTKGVDGDFGRNTLAAVKAFQRRFGLSQDGVVGPKTWGKLAQAVAAKTASSASATLKKGSTGAAVKTLQQKLAQHGFSPGAADGDFGNKTLAAVKSFQRAKGLTADGVVGPKTWAKLNAAVAAKSSPSSAAALKKGSTGAAVKTLQQKLAQHGFSPGAADGDFGNKTLAAVRSFQRAKGLTADGVVGPKTWAKLNAAPKTGSGPTLKEGHRGTPVKQLQQRLAQLGFNPGGADGIFGNGTERAVKAFQRAKGLSADGVVGPKTWAKLGITVTGKPTGSVGGSSGIHAGGGWGGSEGVANRAKQIARSMGIPLTSTKRNYAQSIAVGSGTYSDHYTGNTGAYAVDFGVAGSRGDTLARKIADAYGIPRSAIGTYNRYIKVIDGKRYSIQMLWRVKGHYDHVHFGIRRA